MKTLKMMKMAFFVAMMAIVTFLGCEKEEDDSLPLDENYSAVKEEIQILNRIYIPSDYTVIEVLIQIFDPENDTCLMSSVDKTPTDSIITTITDAKLIAVCSNSRVDFRYQILLTNGVKVYKKTSTVSGVDLRDWKYKNHVIQITIDENELIKGGPETELITEGVEEGLEIVTLIHIPSGYTIVETYMQMFNSEECSMSVEVYNDKPIIVIDSGNCLASIRSYKSNFMTMTITDENTIAVCRNYKIDFQYETLVTDGSKTYKEISIVSEVDMSKWGENNEIQITVNKDALIRVN